MVLFPACGCCPCECPTWTRCAYSLPVSEPAVVSGHFLDCDDQYGNGNTATSASVTVSAISPYTNNIVDNPTVTTSKAGSATCSGWSRGYEADLPPVYGYRASFSLSASLDCEPDAIQGSRSFLRFGMFLEVVRSTIYGTSPEPGCTGRQDAGYAIRVTRTATKKHFLGACETHPGRHCNYVSAEDKNKPYRFWPSGFGAWVDYTGTSFGGWDSNVRAYSYLDGCYPDTLRHADAICNILQTVIPRLSFTVEHRNSCDPNPLP